MEAMPGPPNCPALNPTLKLTVQVPFSMLGKAGLKILREIWGSGDDTWVDHTWVNQILKSPPSLAGVLSG